MFVSLGIDFAEVRKVSRAIEPLRAQYSKLTQETQALQNSFNQPESQAVLQRTRFANALIEHKGFSVVNLITALESNGVEAARLYFDEARFEPERLHLIDHDARERAFFAASAIALGLDHPAEKP